MTSGVRLTTRSLLAAIAIATTACPKPAAPPPRRPPTPAKGAVTISIVGTNDLHGALVRLPILAGYVANLRAARAADGGAVVLIDAGDMFQGTLESNLNEGEAVIAAYNQIGYDASTVGNHEFDFGPPGPAVTIQSDDDDPRGALKLRATEAHFPILSANIADAETGSRIKWKNMPASKIIDAAGVKVGVIGVTTEATPFTTMPANFRGLAMIKPAAAVAVEAKKLREDGAQIIVVAAHVGSKCKDLGDPTDTSSCDTGEEVFGMIAALPHGLVDVIIAGHTHAAIAHRIADIAVIESYSSGRAFGRVDLRVSGSGVVTASKIFKPQDLCPLTDNGDPVPVADCTLGDYEGKPVVADAKVAATIAPAIAAAKDRREQPLGVTLAGPIPRAYDAESAEGNLFADLMLAAHPEVDVALTNGGGLRADLPAGPLNYGALFEAMPFDNRFALVSMQGKHLRKLVVNNLLGGAGIFSYAGVKVVATCKDGQLAVELFDGKGKKIGDEQSINLVTSDFLASGGGDGVVGRLDLPDGAIEGTDVLIRDAMADLLKKRGGTITAKDAFDPKHPRQAYPGPRPVHCATP